MAAATRIPAFDRLLCSGSTLEQLAPHQRSRTSNCGSEQGKAGRLWNRAGGRARGTQDAERLGWIRSYAISCLRRAARRMTADSTVLLETIMKFWAAVYVLRIGWRKW